VCPSDLPVPSIMSALIAAQVALDLSWRLAPLPAFALVRAPLRRHIDSRLLLCGGVFGLRQPLVQDVGLSLALSQRHLDFMSGLALLWRFAPAPRFTIRCISAQGFDIRALVLAIVTIHASPRWTRPLCSLSYCAIQIVFTLLADWWVGTQQPRSPDWGGRSCGGSSNGVSSWWLPRG
jgi:hypothetical protein